MIDAQIRFNQVFFCRSVPPEILRSFLRLLCVALPLCIALHGIFINCILKPKHSNTTKQVRIWKIPMKEIISLRYWKHPDLHMGMIELPRQENLCKTYSDLTLFSEHFSFSPPLSLLVSPGIPHICHFFYTGRIFESYYFRPNFFLCICL